jgi:hypothetical protein
MYMVTEWINERYSWRIRLARKIVWLLAIKFVALLILWALFFSPTQRVDVSPVRSAEHLALDPQSTAP